MFRKAGAIAVLATVTACATPHPGNMLRAYADPYEKTNRRVFAFNQRFDRYALHPTAKVYRAVIPRIARHGITNVLNNIEEPLSLLNAALQGNLKEAGHTAARFVINSTVGIGGLSDFASRHGRPAEREDFGQTLAVWGVKSGAYLMLPILGPSTFRDTVGFGVDIATNPFTYARSAVVHWPLTYTIAQFGLKAVSVRSELIDAGADKFLAASMDQYVTVRSAFLQRRQFEIYNGNPPVEDEINPGDAPLAPGAVQTLPISPNKKATSDPVINPDIQPLPQAQNRPPG